MIGGVASISGHVCNVGIRLPLSKHVLFSSSIVFLGEIRLTGWMEYETRWRQCQIESFLRVEEDWKKSESRCYCSCKLGKRTERVFRLCISGLGGNRNGIDFCHGNEYVCVYVSVEKKSS